MPNGPYRRRTARVFVLDSAGRVLLLKFAARRQPLGSAWFTPGGGVDGDEPLREAAARELFEEIGLAVCPDALGPLVAETSGYAELSWAKGLFRDDFFQYRVDGDFRVDLSGLEPRERSSLLDYRWWTVEELATTIETVYPLELAPLAAALNAGRIPVEPVKLPWHH